ncbi:hypothetical protein Prudu_001023 [Prunus dulcis]|uniref:Uncharacterized protein n=1 Tax=Prunus dulcis TaxID=3755 RepID=A0A4Y1QMS1_PRUDU|nr:hypothetical protein Prudu_001023 [Prunus dulcis]
MKGHHTWLQLRKIVRIGKRRGDFRREDCGGACGGGDFRRSIRGATNKMSESSDRESLDPPAFGGDDTESDEPSQYICSEEEDSETEGLVEGTIESRMIGPGGERGQPSEDSGSAAYREMQRNYIELEAIANRVLALPQTQEVGSSNQASPSGSVGIAVASVSEGLDIRVGVPLPRRNTLTEAKLAQLRKDFCVPAYVGLRLPIEADVVRYPSDGSVMIFTDMYRHGFRLPFHPWVQMMLAKLGYAPRQYNPNFWLLLHGVYIAWWLAGLGEPTFEQFMYLYSISKQQGNFGWVQANCRKARERGYFIGHKPTTQKSWRNRWCMAYGDWECPPGKSVVQHIPTHFQSIGSVKWGPISKEQEDEVEWVRAQLSETERECGNLVTQKNLLRQQKKEVNLAMHRHEVPLVNVFLEGVKSDPEALAKTPASSFIDWAQKTILTSAYAFGEIQEQNGGGAGGHLREERLAGAKGGPGQGGSVKWGPISKEQEDEVEWVAGIIRGSTKVAVDIDEAEMQKRLRESRAKKAEKSAGKRPRDDDEGRVADVLGKRKALEEAHQHVMGSGPRLPPFDLQAPPKLPFGMEDVDFGRLRQQKKEVNLAMHRQEVPLAFGEMYVSMAKADKEIQRLKRRDEQPRANGGGAGGHPREERLAGAKGGPGQGGGGAEEVEGREVAAARVEAIESFRSSEELKSYIMDRLVDEQLRWEDRLVRFNPRWRLTLTPVASLLPRPSC